MIVKRLSFEDFKYEFERYSRENQFSEEALERIYSILNRGQDKIEVIDVIEICSVFSELSLEELREYSNEMVISELKNGKYLIRH
jgi:hypothetical protein